MDFTARVETFLDGWFGLAQPTPRRVIEAAGWSSDEHDAYCSRCGESVGPGEAQPSGCAACRSRKRAFDSCVRLGAYKDPLRHWIATVKYDRAGALGEELGSMLGEAVKAHPRIEIDPATTIVAPVPMPWQRRVYRGVDHAHALAIGVGRALDADVHCILRKRNGPTQVSRTATERRRSDLRRRLRLRRRIGGWPIDGLHVVLVDDIRTTGTTLDAAARILRDLGASRVTAAVAAVADEPGRAARQTDEPREDASLRA